ncbi:MAG: tyrosine-type recombinase/integrase [Candidatus Lokiarchaeota archaeon]|nr:tyrosine-type recombinase/integrase [Candidatus Lokiarchaeota archaeon]
MKKTSLDKKNDIIKIFPAFEDFLIFKLEPLAESTQNSNFSILVKFFNIVGKYDPKTYTQNDIKKFLAHDKIKKLSSKSKNQYILAIKKYLKYFDIELKFPKYIVKKNELNKTELITREDLNKILEICNTKKKAMLMVLYEGALRRKELVNIRKKNVVFQNGFVDLYIKESKTIDRNLPLIESIPYLREYFSENKFAPEDKIFGYHPQNITIFINRLTEKLKKIYPDWSKDLYPHLFRHSRLTELAATQLNEPQLRKFAGWSGDSDMPKIYFHLDDTDLRNILIQQNGQNPIEKKKPKTFKQIVCKVCKAENSQQNVFCYKCGNVVNKDRVVFGRVKEQIDIDELKKNNKELTERLEALSQEIKERDELSHNLWKEVLVEEIKKLVKKQAIKP